MTPEPLSPSTVAFLLADQPDRSAGSGREGTATRGGRGQRAPARPAGSDLDMPLIFTASEEEGQNLHGQRGGRAERYAAALPPADLARRAYASRIDRHEIIDSLADPAVAEALSATGQRQLITAGISTEVCGIPPPALHAQRDDYQVAFVADAYGSLTELGHAISLRRLEREGITLTTTAMVIAELTGDYPITPRSCGPTPAPTPMTPTGDRRPTGCC